MKTQAPRNIRLPEVINLTGLSGRTIYRWMKKGDFPKQKKHGKQVAYWIDQEILQWKQDQIKEYLTA